MEGAVRARFISKIGPENERGCWEWLAGRHEDGYGTFWMNGTNHKAHRVSYELEHGPIPAGMQVLHRCDNPPCVNPSHLFLGTNNDNVQDKVTKGRQPRQLGERNGAAKLTAFKVEQIRRLLGLRWTQTRIASTFGVTQAMVSLIKLGKNWNG